MMEKPYSLQQELADIASAVERELDRLLPLGNCTQEDLPKAMRYSLLGGGKRLRAALLMEFCICLGGHLEDALPFACAVEMIQSYSLIHDDLPCMDNDDMRRGKPSCHKAFGEATALLAGDALLTKAFEVMLSCPVSAEKKVRTAQVCATAIGTCGMIGGQMLDLANEGHVVSKERLKDTYLQKTAAFIRAASVMGAVLGDADAKTIEYVDEYAYYLGLAFQIFDDILDRVGNADKLGKPIGSDAQNNKTTYVTLFSIEQATEIAADYIRKAKDALSCMNIHEGLLVDMADMMIHREN